MIDLTPLQQNILNCVRDYSGQYTRSGLAKLLVGSRSTRLDGWQGNVYYGRFSNYPRKMLVHEIDILLQQGFLSLDWQSKLIIAQPDSRAR